MQVDVIKAVQCNTAMLFNTDEARNQRSEEYLVAKVKVE